MSTDVEVVKRCTRRRQRTPFRKLKEEEMTEGERIFETLKKAVDPPRRRERPKNSWIRGGRGSSSTTAPRCVGRGG